MRRNLVRVLTNTFGIHLLGYLFTPLPLLFAVFLSEMRSKKFQKFVQSATTLPNFVGWVVIYSLVNSFFVFRRAGKHRSDGYRADYGA